MSEKFGMKYYFIKLKQD